MAVNRRALYNCSKIHNINLVMGDTFYVPGGLFLVEIPIGESEALCLGRDNTFGVVDILYILHRGNYGGSY